MAHKPHHSVQQIQDLPTEIIKRDGSCKRFLAGKKNNSRACLPPPQPVRSALIEGEGAAAKKIKVHRHRYTSIEDIQDIVEQALIAADFVKTARAYIVYREQHKRLRDDRKTLIDVAASVNEYLEQQDWRVNANANQGYSLGGLILNVAGKVIANYWLSHVYPPEVGAAHRDGDIHIHDLDMLAGYCAGWSLRTVPARRVERRAGQGRGEAARSTCRARSARSSTSSARCRTNGPARRRSARSTPTWRRSSARTASTTRRSSSASRSSSTTSTCRRAGARRRRSPTSPSTGPARKTCASRSRSSAARRCRSPTASCSPRWT